MSIEKLIAKYEKVTQEIEDAVGEDVFVMLKKYPNVKSISFVHYTPFYSDGEATNWSLCVEAGQLVYVDDMGVEETIGLEELREYVGYDRELKKSTYKVTDHPASQLVLDFINYIEAIPEEIIENSFSEGEVVFHQDGTVTEEDYDHE